MKLAMPDIVRATAMHYRLTVADILSDDTGQKCARPRQVAMVLCRNYTSRSLPQIGAYFGRDHTTVLHALREMGPGTGGIIGVAPARAAILEMARRLAAVRLQREHDWVARLHKGEVSWVRHA